MAIRAGNVEKEFKINSYLKLKLESGRTNIYVKNKLFRQCMYLLMNIPVNKIEEFDDIKSIDEAALKLDRRMEGNHSIISPEEEFMGHCSNLQAWTENGYDTRILHRNLAFPLLKRLTQVGDSQAKKVFKEEIAIRFTSGHPTVIQYLTQNGYLKYLSAEEFESILDDIDPIILQEITAEINYVLEHSQNTNSEIQINYKIRQLLRNFGIEHISSIVSRIIQNISEKYREPVVKAVYNLLKERKKFPLIQYINHHLEYFKDFEFDFDLIKYSGKLIGFFKDNKIYLRNQNIVDINKIDGLEKNIRKIEELDLSNNLINTVKKIEKFSNLKCLKLNNNQITNIEGIKKLKNLQELYLRNNKISEIKELGNLVKLKHLDLSGNINITEIPDCLNKLPALNSLKLWNCSINKYSDSTSKFFWMDQNYRYYKGYTQNDKTFYEKTHNRVASSHNGLYKHFIQWVIKMKRLMTECNFTYQDIENYERDNTKKAIWSGRPTNSFIKWLQDKKQMLITDFF